MSIVEKRLQKQESSVFKSRWLLSSILSILISFLVPLLWFILFALIDDLNGFCVKLQSLISNGFVLTAAMSLCIGHITLYFTVAPVKVKDDKLNAHDDEIATTGNEKKSLLYTMSSIANKELIIIFVLIGLQLVCFSVIALSSQQADWFLSLQCLLYGVSIVMTIWMNYLRKCLEELTGETFAEKVKEDMNNLGSGANQLEEYEDVRL